MKASLQEQFIARQRDLDLSMKQYARQVVQYEEMHQKLLEWYLSQEERVESAVKGVIDRTSPVASARFQSMLETFELNLRRVLEEQSVIGQQQAARDMAQLSISLQHVQTQVTKWVESLHDRATSSVHLIHKHNVQLQRATLQSSNLETNMIRLDERLDKVRIQLEEDLLLSQVYKENGQKVAAMMSEAALLLNSSVHHFNHAHDEKGTLLGWISFIVGKESWATLKWWWTQLQEGLELKLRELSYGECEVQVSSEHLTTQPCSLCSSTISSVSLVHTAPSHTALLLAAEDICWSLSDNFAMEFCEFKREGIIYSLLFVEHASLQYLALFCATACSSICRLLFAQTIGRVGCPVQIWIGFRWKDGQTRILPFLKNAKDENTKSIQSLALDSRLLSLPVGVRQSTLNVRQDGTLRVVRYSKEQL